MRHLNKLLSLSKISVLALTFLLILQPLVASADYDPVLEPDQDGNRPNIIEKYLSKLLMNIGNWLIDVSNAQDVSVLVFQRPEIVNGSGDILNNASSSDRANMVLNIFPSGLFDGISEFNTFFTSLLPIPIIVIFVGVGLFLMFDLMNSTESRSKWKEVLFGTIVALMLMRFGHVLWEWIIYTNYILVDGIYVVLTENGVEVTRFVNTIWDSSQYSELTETQSLGVALMIIVATFMTFIMNYQYQMRMLTLGLLIIMFPAVLLTSIIPSRKGGLNLWFSTFTSNVFIQAGHAIALGMFFYSLTKVSTIGFWLVLSMLFGLPAMADVVNRIIGSFTGEGAGGGLKTSASNMSGLANLMAVGKIGSQVMGKGGSDKSKTSTKDTNPKTQSDSSPMDFWKTDIGTGDPSGGSNSGQTSGNGTIPVKDSLNGNGEQVGGSGKQGLSSGRQKLSSFGKGMAKAGKAMAQSEFGRHAVRRGATIAGGVGGFIIGSMSTGNGTMGSVLGSKVANPIGKTVDKARQKLGKATQLGGEILHSSAEKGISGALDATKERLGYDDTAQLASPKEAMKMGEELIGGKTGQAIGALTGAGGNLLARVSGEKGRANLDQLRDAKSLDEQIDHSKQQQPMLEQDLHTAQTSFNNAEALYGSHTEEGKAWKQKNEVEYRQAKQSRRENPNNSKAQERLYNAEQNRKAPHPEVQKAKQKLDDTKGYVAINTHKTRQLEIKRANHHKIGREAKNMMALQQRVRSSGQV